MVLCPKEELGKRENKPRGCELPVFLFLVRLVMGHSQAGPWSNLCRRYLTRMPGADRELTHGLMLWGMHELSGLLTKHQ